MADADSGTNPASRFFNYRWAYISLACLLWFNLLLVMTGEGEMALFAPTYLIWNVLTGDFTKIGELSAQGVFGFDFGYGDASGAAFLALLLMAGLIAAFITPESGQTKRLPAMRGLHLRAKLIASFIIGLASAAIIAGLLDAVNADMVKFFTNLGLMPVQNYHGFITIPDNFRPRSGIISLLSLSVLAAIVMFAGGASFIFMCLTKLGRDRYWQVERRTLFLTLISLAMIILSLPFLENDIYIYYYHDIFLGGCYTTWIVGWMILTFAWTCRTILLMMMQSYEQASLESDEPNCFACGYDLRMLTTPQCPECGTPVSPKRMEKIIRQTEESMAKTQAESRSTTR